MKSRMFVLKLATSTSIKAPCHILLVADSMTMKYIGSKINATMPQ